MISSLKERYEDQLNDWKKQCNDKDKLIKALKAEIEKLKAEIKKLEARYTIEDVFFQFWSIFLATRRKMKP